MNIEARTMMQMARRDIIPAIMRYIGDLAKASNAAEAAGMDTTVQKTVLRKLSGLLSEAQAAVDSLEKCTLLAEAMEPGRSQAVYFHDYIVPGMALLRAPVDEAERFVERSYWPMPTYSDLLFKV